MPIKTNNEGNILLVANWESNVGYAWWLMENFWVTIANHFETTGKHSFLIYPKITTIPDTIASTNIKTMELDFSNHSFTNLLKLHKFIKSNAIRNIYLSDSPFYSWFYILLRMYGITKIVVHDHTPGERKTPSLFRKTIKKLIQAIPFYNADHFVAVSEFVHDRHLRVNCINSKKCSVASNGINPFNLSDIDNSYTQRQFNIAKDKIIIVTTGRASYYKGIDFFIYCANELINKQGLKQLHFLFCGDGPDLEKFKHLCNELKLENHFTFAGKRTDVKEILPSCDIGLHASKGEVGYSLSILEYMSAGLATIVPDRPSTSDATRHLETGLTYHNENITSACEAIKLCLPDEFRKHLASNAIKEVITQYDIRNTNEKLISILSHVYT